MRRSILAAAALAVSQPFELIIRAASSPADRMALMPVLNYSAGEPGTGKRHQRKTLAGILPHQGTRECARRRRQLDTLRRRRRTWEEEKLRACVECILYVANGDVPDDRDALPDEVAEMWPPAEGWQLCMGDPEQDDEFSWSPCQCCGSHLGGARHEVIALRETTPPT